MTITLERLLANRDRRRSRQQELLRKFPEEVLLLFTVVIPGADKRIAVSDEIFRAGTAALMEEFFHEILKSEIVDAESGMEFWVILRGDRHDVKRRVCLIEDSHPLGRLMDIDVIGSGAVPVSRQEIGLPHRGCLICDRPARECMRAMRHTQDELLAEINRRVSIFRQFSP